FWYQDFVAGLQKRDHRIKNPLLSTRCCHYLCWIVGHAKLPRIEIDNRLLQLPSASCRRVFRLPAAHCLLSCELDVFGSIKIRFPSAKIDNINASCSHVFGRLHSSESRGRFHLRYVSRYSE